MADATTETRQAEVEAGRDPQMGVTIAGALRITALLDAVDVYGEHLVAVFQFVQAQITFHDAPPQAYSNVTTGV